MKLPAFIRETHCGHTSPAGYQGKRYEIRQEKACYLTIRPVARKGYGSIAHEAKPNGLLTRGLKGRRV